MQKIMPRIFSGVVCEQEVMSISERAAKNVKTAKPRLRFKDDEERRAHRLGIALRRFIRLVNATFSPTSLYSTLTLDDEHEVHTFEEADRLADNFIRRVKYHYPQARLVIVKGRGKSTQRIHFHMISEGVPKEAIEGDAHKGIKSLWGLGDVLRVVNLREHNYYENVDHGQDYTGLATYLFNHWTEEQGGHRWRGTRLVKPDRDDPEQEEPRLAKINYYSKKRPPAPPKGYIYVGCTSTPYGYYCFKYVRASGLKKGRVKGE